MTAEPMVHLPLLLVAAFLAGALNAAAGGGSFLTLPALIVAGLPPVAANATGTVALLPGYISGTLGFREDMRMPSGLSLRSLVVMSLAGGAAGAGLLLLTPNKTFDVMIPWLLLIATAAFAFGPRLSSTGGVRSTIGLPVPALSIFLVAVYGGYFNGGLGIALLALFSLLGLADLNAANGLKNLVSALLTAIAVVVYACGGTISWPEALIMMAAATVGSYLGARAVRRMEPTYVRYGIVMIGLAMTMFFFSR
ncbi:MAG TPA: sulfite exporter TauE/SafE family protein [Nitrococcus sp.]|nr:sulfite exporter TauE/SafE family protein [Nitrococcus sp.]